MKSVMVFLLCMLLLPSWVQAETAFVTDRLFVSIRDGQGKQFAVVKSVAAGTELDVVQRVDGFAQVHGANGVEGWIAERYLVNVAPGSAQLQVVKNKLQWVGNQVTRLKQQLVASSKTADSLRQKLISQGGKITAEAGSDDESARIKATGAAPSAFFFSWLWLLIAFAMLVTGFVAGVIWLRELNRKKMGGMYLRI